MDSHTFSRRTFLTAAALAATVALHGRDASAQEQAPFKLNYNLASCMFGELPLDDVLAQVKAIGAETIDLWPRRHANHREQVEEMGHDAYRALLDKHGVRTGMITRYDLGPFKLQNEMKVANSFGAAVMVAGSGKGKGDTLQDQVQNFVEALKPHVAVAEENGVTLAIENHANSLINTPDSIRYFAEYAKSPNLGIALAPYHLPQDPKLVGDLIREIGPKLSHFYAWEHGLGSTEKMPKILEMKQLPGYGTLDFKPIIEALRDIKYTGWTCIFMHPVPRGIPILPTAPEVSAAINRSREYLDSLI